MKVTVLGDRFVVNAVLQSAFERVFAGSGLEFEYNYLTTDWPVVPVQKIEEVCECVGDPDAIAEAVAEAEIILTHSSPIVRRAIEGARNLKVVGAARGGPVNINWAACTERGIPVLYAPGRNSGAVAEFTIGMMLAQSRSIPQAHMSLMVDRRWRGDLYVHEAVGNELGCSTVGLIGLGAIGGKVARIASAFGASILVYDPYVKPEDLAPLGYKFVSLDDLLAESDFISLHARLTKETAGLIGPREIGLMKKTVYLVNTARGELIQMDALYAALKERRIAGAALDVFEAEPPPPDSPIYHLENVTATSHLAGASIQAAEIGANVLAQGIYDYIVKHQNPRFCANPDYIKYQSIL